MLNTCLTPELIEEGLVRELVSKIQTMRKEADFDVTDYIVVYIQNNERIMSVLRDNETKIKREVLAKTIQYGTLNGTIKEWTINGENVMLGVESLSH